MATSAKPRIRQKAWNPKVRTGCRTCKKRRLKCDEEKPSCQRCIRSKVVCDGYEPPPKAWIFDINLRSKDETSQSSSDSPVTSSSWEPDSSGSPERCQGCGSPDGNCQCQSVSNDGLARTVIDAMNHPDHLRALALSSSPYRGPGEQMAFKYFLEVPALITARSALSSAFWLQRFPQAAYSEPAVRDAIISCALGARHIYDATTRKATILTISPQALVYENRSIQSLVTSASSVETALTASQAFLLNSILFGDWNKALRHSYHVVQLCSSLTDRSKHDQIVVIYAEAMARFVLGYFRTTRGPCPIHGGEGDILTCSASCYVAEETASVEMRFADGMFHLRSLPSALIDHQKVLICRTKQHSQHQKLMRVLGRWLSEASSLVGRWSDLEQHYLDRARLRQAQLRVPCTNSPFTPVLRDLGRYIEEDQDSHLLFNTLELRMRFTMPCFIVSTGRQDARIVWGSLLDVLRLGHERSDI